MFSLIKNLKVICRDSILNIKIVRPNKIFIINKILL